MEREGGVAFWGRLRLRIGIRCSPAQGLVCSTGRAREPRGWMRSGTVCSAVARRGGARSGLTTDAQAQRGDLLDADTFVWPRKHRPIQFCSQNDMKWKYMRLKKVYLTYEKQCQLKDWSLLRNHLMSMDLVQLIAQSITASRLICIFKSVAL